MATKLIIARHGNTFNKGDVILRVGGRSDLPLTEEGLKQGERLGLCLKKQGIKLDKVFASPLKRAVSTAGEALKSLDLDIKITKADFLTEVDYGIDEAKSEEEVVARVGNEAMERWNNSAIPPNGWNIDVNKIIKSWSDFAESVKSSDETIMVVTSNGVARFALWLLDEYKNGKEKDLNIKLATGAYGELLFENNKWNLKSWNLKPKEIL